MKLLICAQTVDQNHPILGFFVGWILEFSKYFDEVYVICLEKGEYNLPEHVKVFSLGKEAGAPKIVQLVRFYRFFIRIFFSVRVEYVFFHMGAIYNVLASPFFFLRKLYKTQFYWWKAHGHINAFGRLALCFVDRVYTSTKSGFPIDTKKRHVIGQAIDTHLFVMSERVSRRGIVFVGRITPVKHLEIFLETCVLLRDAGLQLDVQVIGPHDDKQYLQKLKQYCVDHHINPEIFIGSRTQSELAAIYQSTSIFLNTSKTHSMDKTVVESMLCGCIPVTGNRAFRGLLEEDELYIEDADVQDYVNAIQRLLSRDDLENLRQKLSEKANSQHSLDTFTKRVFTIG